VVAFAIPDIRMSAHEQMAGIRAAAGGSATPIAAMGIIASVQQPLHADPSTANARQRTGRIAWVYVLTPSFGAGRSASNATVIVPCTDGWTGMFNMKKRTSCLCKTLHWLQAALPIFPTAAYIGKVEDDAIVNEAALLRDLEWAWRQTGHCGSSGRGNSGERDELQWYGKFDWAAHEAIHEAPHQSSALRATRAKYCGGGDNLVTRHKPPLSTCGSGLDRPTVAPFAEGGLDVRSRAFVQLSVACEAAWAAAARDKPGGASAGLGACDGVQGYLLAQCIGNSSVDLFHLTWLQFAHSPTAHAVVLHSQKSRRQRMA